MKIVRIGIIGLGARGETLLASIFEMGGDAGIEVTALCDISQERIERIKNIFQQRNVPVPAIFTDYRQLLHDENVDAVLIPTSWNSHLKIAGEAMQCGKYAGIEVGGA